MTRTMPLGACCVALLVGLAAAPVRAQSALDGFNPGANFTVSAVALQPDGSGVERAVGLQPKGSGSLGPRVVIDAPRSHQDVAQPFVLGGWRRI